MLILTGLCAGAISGMGIGGGVVLIPVLTLYLALDQHSAQGINLAYILPTAAAALFTHVKNKSVEKSPLGLLIFFGLVGAFAGAFLALRLDSALLKKIFGGFLLILGLGQLLIPRLKLAPQSFNHPLRKED